MKRILCCLIAFCVIAPIFACPKYKVVDLNTTNKEMSIATSINDNGEICGIYKTSNYPSETKLFLWSQCTGIICPNINMNLDYFYSDFPFSQKSPPSLFINNQGQVAGRGLNFIQGISVWDPQEGIKLLCAGNHTTKVHDFNDFGEIVYTQDNNVYICKINGQQQNLGKLFEDKFRIQINNKSELFGTAMSSNGYLVARFHALKEKRTYDVNNILKSNFYATAFNDLSQGTIYWQSPNKTGSGIWSATTGMQHFDSSTPATKINKKGQMISGAGFFDRGWIDMNTLLDLANDPSTPFERIEAIYDINNRGQMVGTGIIKGKSHAILITPICEYCK